LNIPDILGIKTDFGRWGIDRQRREIADGLRLKRIFTDDKDKKSNSIISRCGYDLFYAVWTGCESEFQHEKLRWK
jgi:hypothetical protein